MYASIINYAEFNLKEPFFCPYRGLKCLLNKLLATISMTTTASTNLV